MATVCWCSPVPGPERLKRRPICPGRRHPARQSCRDLRGRTTGGQGQGTLPLEYPLLRSGQLLFTYLHLAPDPAQAEALLACGCTAIAYETVTRPDGTLPLLIPMSEIAGDGTAGRRPLAAEGAGRQRSACWPGPGGTPRAGGDSRRRHGRQQCPAHRRGHGADVTVFDIEPGRLARWTTISATGSIPWLPTARPSKRRCRVPTC